MTFYEIAETLKEHRLRLIEAAQIQYNQLMQNGSSTKEIGRFLDFNWLPWQSPLTN